MTGRSQPKQRPTSNPSKSPLCVMATKRRVGFGGGAPGADGGRAATGPSQEWGCASTAVDLELVAKRRCAAKSSGRVASARAPTRRRTARRSAAAMSSRFVSTALCIVMDLPPAAATNP